MTQRTRYWLAMPLLLGSLWSGAGSAQQSLPEEMRTLINAYAIGLLNVEHLQGVCRWGSAQQGANWQMTQVRTQNVAFCDGFLAATADFARLDSATLQSRPPAQRDALLSCRNLSAESRRVQFMASQDLRRTQNTLASEFLLETLFSCAR